MTVEAFDLPQTVAIAQCGAQNCANFTDGSVNTSGVSFCRAHRRALALTAALSDAVLQFLRNGGQAPIRPGRTCDPDIKDAGTYFAIGLDCLLRSVFGRDMSFDPMPLTPIYNASDGFGPRWRVNFDWSIGKEGSFEPVQDDEDQDNDDSEGYDDDDD